MKLHLPSALRRALLATFAVAVSSFAEAATLHSQVTLQTYTDFGQNMGRYVTASRTNALLAYIRGKEGITITYTDGREAYRLETDQMVSFDGQTSEGAFAAIGYNFLASVQHNGTPNPTFTTQELPANHSVRYTGIEYRSSDKFLNTPDTDYKITRLSKVITDVTTSNVYQGEVSRDTLLYRAGAGVMSVRDTDGKITVIYDAYSYITGGIVRTDGMSVVGKTGDSRGLSVRFDYSKSGISELNPLPFSGDSGDSGSPVWIWNEATGAYEYVVAVQAVNGVYGTGTNTYCKGAPEWTVQTMDSYSKAVDIGAGTNTVYVNAVKQQSETVVDSAGREGEKWIGTVTNINGDLITEFQGVQSGINTWHSLTPEIDNSNWYAYTGQYLNAGDAVSDTKELSKATLFLTENLVFSSASASNNVIIDDEGVDLGVGYAHFSRSDNAVDETINYSIRGGMFNHAGYVVDKGVAVHLTEANTDADYVREWRKVGEGDLYIEGTGNNQVVLNLGGSGSIYLNEQGGNAYAAYNVLANTGARVVLQGGVNQIARDFSFGNGGGYLDFYGHSMTWDNSVTDTAAEGFTIHALTEEGVITNSSATDVTLTITNADSVFLGSFQDQEGAGALNIVYNGTEKWTLNTIATDLCNSGKSSFTVQSGSVELAGTNTKHAMGSIDGRSTKRLENAEDWHYADATMDVTVESNANFTLGSHARLTGNIVVSNDASFTMREGVTHRVEYVEGGQILEDTYEYVDFYGLQGNITLKNSFSLFEVSYSQDTDANTELKGNICGTGIMYVNAANGSLTLSGDNSSFSGSKEVFKGALIAKDMKAVGDVSSMKWVVDEAAWLTVENATGEDILSAIDRLSHGVLALSSDQAQLLDLSGHQYLFIGAQEGKQVTYGTSSQELKANNAKKWLLGGGGGELIVEAKLNDKDATLVLGNAYTKGIVTLKNTDNQIGSIDFAGLVTLQYEDANALGGATINLTYGNRVMGTAETLDLLPTAAAGTMLLDKMTGSDIVLGNHTSLYLGAAGNTTYTGTITTADNTYRLGGSTGVLSLEKALTDSATGTRNLIIDGQFYTGGVIELLAQATLTGEVTVMGYDPTYASAVQGEDEEEVSGDATLRLSADDAIASAASVTLKKGGILDTNGHNQTINNLSGEEGSLLTDDSGSTDGLVTLFNTVETTYSGSIELDSFTKKGSATLKLNGGGKNYNQFTIAEGVVSVLTNNALSSTGITTVAGNAYLDATQSNVTANLHLQNAATVMVSGSTLGGQIYATDGTSTIHNGTSNVATISATINVARNATLKLSGNALTLTNASINTATDAGTVSVYAKQLNINNQATANIGGTLSFDAQTDQTLYSDRSNNNTTRNIAKLNISGGENKKLTITERTWNTIWNIAELTGEGKFEWNSSTTHWYSSRIVLNGENDFEGIIQANRTRGEKNDRAYASYLELAHDMAAQKADVILSGKNGDNYMTLAVNTDNAQMKSLTGNEYTALYAGESLKGEQNVTGNGLNSAPSSTRCATLTITGSSDAEFKGNVYGREIETGDGISLVMSGTATQSFTGSHVALQDITVQSGTLAITSTDFSRSGNITLYRGAELRTQQETSLQTGQTLTIAGSGLASATLTSGLVLQGGTLAFDGAAMNNSSVALTLNNGITLGEGIGTQKVSFINVDSLVCGAEYQLSTGNWNTLNLNYEVEGIDYMTANITAKESGGLYVTFTAATDYIIWNGTPENNIWSNSVFGNQGNQPQDSSTVVFNDAATGHNVQLEGSLKTNALLFANTVDYNVGTTDESATLEVQSIAQRGEGRTTLNKGVQVAQNGQVTLEAGKLTVTDDSVLRNAGSISGEGTLELLLAQSDTLTTLTGTNDLRRLEINRGTLDTAETLNVREISIAEQGTLHSTTAAPVVEGTTVELAGTLELALSSDTALNTKVSAGVEGQKGTIIKSGSGTLNLGAEIGAAMLDVQEGSFAAGGGGNLVHLLKHVDTLRVGDGATLSLGGNAYTIGGDNFTNNFVADGGTLNMAIAQHVTKTVTGTLSVTNGGTLNMYDGGLRFTGNISLGASAGDSVTLKGNYGKGGIILDGTVSGQGTVEIADGGNSGPQKVTLSNNGNTFSGTYQVNSRTQLVLQGERSAATADINLTGGTLALETAKATTRGLSGNGSVTFNGAEGVTGTTLELAGSKDYDFSGSIGSGISLSMSSGSQTMAGNSSAFSGNVTVSGGTLRLNDGAIVSNAEAITVASGGELHLGGEMSLLHTSIDNSGSVIYDDTARYSVSTANLQQQGSYVLVSGMGNVNADNLTLADFYIAGTDITMEYYSDKVTLQKGETGRVSLEITADSPGSAVYWTGSKTDMWDLATTTNWTNKEDDALAFVADSVIFGSDGADHTQVTVAEGTAVANATITDGKHYTFSQTSNLTILDTLTVDAGATAEFDTLPVAQTTEANGLVKAATADITRGTHTFNGTTTLTGDNATNALVINGGETTFNGTTSIGKNVVINSGTTKFNGEANVTGTISVGGQRDAVISIGENSVLTAKQFNSTWGFSSLTVDGVLNADSMKFSSGSNHTDYIGGGGTINAGSLELGSYSNYTISGVRLNIGGLKLSNAKPGTITVADATIGMLTSSLSPNGLSMVLAGEVTIDTALYDKASGKDTDTGAYLELYSGALTGSGKLVKTGVGVLDLNSNNNTYTGGTEIKGGILRASKSAALANGDVRIDADGTLQLVGSGAAARDVTLAGGCVELYNGTKYVRTLAADSLTIEGSGSLGKLAAIQVKGSGTTSVTLTGQDGGSSIIGNATMSANEDGSISLRGDGTTVNSGGNTKETRLDTAIDLSEGTRLEMENLTLSTEARVVNAADGLLAAKSLKIEAQVDVNLIENIQPLTYGMDMPQAKMVSAADSTTVVSYTLSNVSGVTMEGDSLIISLVGDSSALDGVDWLGISLADGGTFMDTLNVSLIYKDAEGVQQTAQGVYTLQQVESVAMAAADAQQHDYVYFHLAGSIDTPEPTTSTLSLLALAGLALRRRRK